jgi:hypothetical protein
VHIEIALGLGLLPLRECALFLGKPMLKALLRCASIALLASGLLAGDSKINDLPHPKPDG